jgi:hypothetical protein
MNEKPGLEPGFFARRATGGLTGYALLPVPAGGIAFLWRIYNRAWLDFQVDLAA